jgi:hypothetical protein
MFVKKIVLIFKYLAPAVLLITALVLSLTYGWLGWHYKKVAVSVSDVEITANQGRLYLELKLNGNNPFPFAVHLKRYEGKVVYGLLSRSFAIAFDPDLLIPPGKYQLARQGLNLTPGYPVGAEDSFLGMLRGKNLQITGEATIAIGRLEKSVPVSMNLTIEK